MQNPLSQQNLRCPVCGANRNRERFMERYERDLSWFLRNNREVTRDSCIYCVEKHIGKSMVLLEELLSARPIHPDHGAAFDARVKTELNHLGIIGNLQAATDESEQWPELHDLLLESERLYRYQGEIPNWERLTELVLNIKTSVEETHAGD